MCQCKTLTETKHTYAQYEYYVLTTLSSLFFMKGIVFFRKVIQVIFSMSTVVTFDVDVNIFSPKHSPHVSQHSGNSKY